MTYRGIPFVRLGDLLSIYLLNIEYLRLIGKVVSWPALCLPDAHISETIFLDGSGIP
jgi:hypothetical protein